MKEPFESRFYPGLAEFPCQSGCVACCRGVLSISIRELLVIGEHLPEIPARQTGCPFRTDAGCRVYPVRPFMCRLFGFHFLHPGMRSQPFCPKMDLIRPGDLETQLLEEYRKLCEADGYVLLGQPAHGPPEAEQVAHNLLMLGRFPALGLWKNLLTGVLRPGSAPSGRRRSRT